MAASPAKAAPILVQHVSKDAGITLSSSLAFPANNTAGNWIGVVVRAGHSGQVFTIRDARGNSYHQAVQLNQTLDAPNGETLAIFYAENIAGGTNTVTVSESLTNNTLRFAILEYSGVALSNSLDITSAAQGSGTTLNSGPATSTVGGDLILGLVATAGGVTFTAGSGYVIEERVPAAPNTKLIAEDAVQAAAGAVSVGATLSVSANGGALLAAFKPATGTISPSITSISPNSGPVGTSVTIAGTNFGGSQGSSTVTFNGVSAGAASNWTPTSITVNVPVGVTGTASVVVVVNGVSSNSLNFTVTSPTITTLTPTTGVVGSLMTVTGANFGGIQGSSTVTFNGTPAGPASSWSATAITVPIPAIGTGSAAVVVTVGGVNSNTANFTVTVGPTYALSVSISSDRSFASDLNGATLQGFAYVFTSSATQLSNSNPTGITQVSYWLDNPGVTGTPVRTVAAAPYDFAGQTTIPAAGLANWWNTSTMADGTHTITQLVTMTSGLTEEDTATFTIQNALTPTISSGHFEYVFGDQNLFVYDLDNNFQLVKHVSLPQINALRGVAPVPSNHVLYVSYGGNGGIEGSGSLLKYDLLTDTVVWTQNYSFGVDNLSITPDGTTIYLPDGAKSGDGIWYVLDALSGNIIGSINTGMKGPHNTIVSLDGTAVFMGPRNSAYLEKADTITNTLALNIGPLRQDVRPFTINGLHTLAFTTSSTDGGSGLGFQVSDTTNGTVLFSVGAPGFSVPSNFPDSPCHGISLSPDEKELYLIDIANGYVHVFDVSGLPISAPAKLADIPLTTNLSAYESPCTTGFDCEREGWLRHTRDGHYVLVGDSGAVIDTTTRQIVNLIPQLLNTRHGNVEIDWQNGLPVSTTTHYGLGYVVPPVNAPPPSIAGLFPIGGPAGTVVAISGANFGALHGSSVVKFGTTIATTSAWSPTSITVTVPATAGPGTVNVIVTVGGQTSNSTSFAVSPPPGVITLVQHASKDAGTTLSSSLAFPSRNTAGNWIAVVIRAGRSGQTLTVKDTLNNAYQKAIVFNQTLDAPHGDTLAIYFAENVAAGSNTVTVSESISGNTLRFAILEYSGIANSSSLDVTAGTQGNGTSPNSGSITTTAAGDLVLGALITGSGVTFTAGGGFAVEERVPAPPNTKLVAEDQIQGAAGGVTASATLSASASWGAAVAAFKSAGNVSPGLPNITGLTPSSGPVTTSVTISGANFGASQGASTVTFNGASAGTAGSWGATSITINVPAGATTGNVVVTVGGVASNGVTFTVTTDTTAPVVNITAPANNATVSGIIPLTATATDPDSAVSFVQFLVDGSNSGLQLTTSPYSTSLDTTTFSNGTHTLTATAQDPSGNKSVSAAISITVSNTTSSAMGPLKQSTVNTRYFVTPSGTAVFLAGSHTWDDFQDTDTNVGSTPVAFDFNAYVSFLKAHNQNATILWRKDLPEYCGWDVSGSTWRMTPWPWLRPGPGVASDGNPQFDLTQFNQAYFDRLRSQVQQLQQNGIYAIIELFDGSQLTSNRCSSDGYPFTSSNNINGISDGYSNSGSCGVGSVTMTTNNAITNIQDAYVKKVIDTVNDLPNVIYEIAEEQPGSAFSGCPGYGGASSMSFWAPHMFGLIETYEAGGTWEGVTYPGKPAQHPYGIGSMNYQDRLSPEGDAVLYSSTAVWIAPAINAGVDMFPSNVPVNNQGKVVINDSDHALGWQVMLNSDGTVKDSSVRTYIWENITQGAESVVFMDPYEIDWPSIPTRNACLNPVNQVCSGVDTKWDNFRTALGTAQAFVNSKMDLVKATPQGSLSSTGFCLADNTATGAEYLVYAPSGGTFTVNLSVTTQMLYVEWLNTATGAITSAPSITGGSSAQSFTAPFSGDAVLYLVDSAGHN